MEERDKAYLYLELLKQQSENLYKRRERELKAEIAFWGAVILGTFLLIKEQIKLSLFIFILIWVIYVLVFGFRFWRSNEIDKQFIKIYRNNIERFIGHTEKLEEYIAPSLKSNWLWGRLIAAGMLLIISWYIVNLEKEQPFCPVPIIESVRPVAPKGVIPKR